MKVTLTFILLTICFSSFSQNPLSLYDSRWDSNVYEECNTAKNCKYMNQREKDYIWVVNCLRKYPSLFYQTIVLKWDYPKRYEKMNRSNPYYVSLLKFMQTVKPVDIFYPDSLVYISAYTHAKESADYYGHERKTQESINAKCNCWEVISYNSFDPIDIVMDLLVDNNNPNYGHRNALMNSEPKLSGASIMKHNKSFYISVLNFK